MTQRVCVVIPAHNESRAIKAVVTAVRAKGLDVLVIDDGSVDETGALAAEAGALVMKNVERSGKGRSLQRGFAQALERGYVGVITMDGDGQHSAGDMDRFIRQIEQTPEAIIAGNRMENPQGMPFVRRATNFLMSWLISCICRQTVADTQCGYRYIPVSFLKSMTLTAGDFEIETEVLVKASRLGFAILAVPVQSIYSDEKSKINPFRDTIRFVRYLLKELSAESSLPPRKDCSVSRVGDVKKN